MTKKIIKRAAKQIAQEPLEILKTAGKQVSKGESAPRPVEPSEKAPEPSVDEAKEKAQSKRMLTALETEIQEIRKEKKLKEQQRLKEEEIEKQKMEEEKEKPLSATPSKRPRGALKGMKGKLKKLKTKAEIRMPPSG